MILAALFVIAGCAWMIRALAADQSSREAAAVLSRNLSFAAAHSGVIAERMTLGGREVLRSLAADIRGAAAERLRAGPNSGIIIRPWLARTLSTDQESGFTASPLRPVIRMVNGPSPWVRSVERGVIAGEPPGAETEKQ